MKKHNSKPFNIQLVQDDQEYTITILPDGNEYKVIYYGKIIGALQESKAGNLAFVNPDQATPGHLPLVDQDQSMSDETFLELKVDKVFIDELIIAVKNH